MHHRFDDGLSGFETFGDRWAEEPNSHPRLTVWYTDSYPDRLWCNLDIIDECLVWHVKSFFTLELHSSKDVCLHSRQHWHLPWTGVLSTEVFCFFVVPWDARRPVCMEYSTWCWGRLVHGLLWRQCHGPLSQCAVDTVGCLFVRPTVATFCITMFFDLWSSPAKKYRINTLNTESSFMDLERYSTVDRPNNSVLSVDPTFNLGEFYLTPVTYQNKGLDNKRSGGSLYITQYRVSIGLFCPSVSKNQSQRETIIICDAWTSIEVFKLSRMGEGCTAQPNWATEQSWSAIWSRPNLFYHVSFDNWLQFLLHSPWPTIAYLCLFTAAFEVRGGLTWLQGHRPI